ncbi:hypothetical protein ABRZ03_03100 [Castellaniella ginsengisoli]|uniref:ProQ/FinO domain-containing protein n=1 Tax=Castellaniella ginsengisoli TaxID=546114 RepID=A0AB39G167_9BURK
MTDNPLKPDPIARYRAVLESLDPRLRQAAKLRALYPLIEPQVAAGVPHAAIMEDLAAAGLPVRRNTYITTLRRWRKARRLAAEETSQATTTLAVEPDTTPAAKPTPPLDAIQGRPSRIQTPGDLRKIRDMRIDLDALRREGLANRAKASQDTETQHDKE